MTTDLVHTPANTQVATMPPPAEWQAALVQAQTLAQTEIVPRAFQGKPHDIMAVWLIGRSMGLDPMQAMNYINVIQGTPSVSPELMNARIRSAGHRIAVVSWDAEHCTIEGTRADTGQVEQVTFTMQDARVAGLVKDKGGWATFPKAMLWARALAVLARVLFPDVILGTRYTPEELGAEVDESGRAMRDTEAPSVALPDHLRAEVANATDVEVIDETPPTRVTPTAAEDAARADYTANGGAQAGPYDGPGADAASGTGAYGTLPDPEPPTPEELHMKAGRDLFRNGFPMGKCKGGDVTDPEAVDTGSLEFLAGLPVKDDQWKATELKRRAWIAAEIARRARLKAAAVPSADEIREAARQPQSGTTHTAMNDEAAERAEREFDDIPFGKDGGPLPTEHEAEFAPTATTPEFPPADPPADLPDAPLSPTWHNRLLDTMVECGFATGVADAGQRIEQAVTSKPQPVTNEWAAAQMAAMRKHAGK